MRYKVLVTALALSIMGAACGDDSSDNAPPADGGLPQADAAPLVSPFVPATIWSRRSRPKG
jgi:hypothetical protein